MRRHCVCTEQFAEMMRHALGHPACVDEDQSGPVRLNQFRKPTVDFLPNFIRHHRFKRRTRQLDAYVQFTAMTDIYDFAIRIAGVIHGASANKETCDFFNRFLRRR